MNTVIFWVYMALAFALLYSAFCRMSMTSKADTQLPIIRAFQILAAAALTCLFAPLLWGYEPDLPIVFLLLGAVAVQFVTAHYWRDGVPKQFRRSTT